MRREDVLLFKVHKHEGLEHNARKIRPELEHYAVRAA